MIQALETPGEATQVWPKTTQVARKVAQMGTYQPICRHSVQSCCTRVRSPCPGNSSPQAVDISSLPNLDCCLQ
ncbi:hypothetical protein RSAG8_04481, partial [Rhizoctonia solani AG-8 WAC10335]